MQLTRLGHMPAPWPSCRSCLHTHRQLQHKPLCTCAVSAGALQTSSETFFRTSKFYKAGDEAPPVFIVDGVSYLSIKV
jgi:hypothetical protein